MAEVDEFKEPCTYCGGTDWVRAGYRWYGHKQYRAYLCKICGHPQRSSNLRETNSAATVELEEPVSVDITQLPGFTEDTRRNYERLAEISKEHPGWGTYRLVKHLREEGLGLRRDKVIALKNAMYPSKRGKRA